MSKKKPIEIEVGEWLYCGCIIQRNEHPALLKYSVFQNIENGKVDTFESFANAKKWCEDNEPQQNKKKYTF